MHEESYKTHTTRPHFSILGNSVTNREIIATYAQAQCLGIDSTKHIGLISDIIPQL
jgi:hypothetical protein